MGFFNGLMKGLLNDMSDADLIRSVNEDEEDELGYRDIAFSNTPSNNGWYECPHCHRKFRRSDMDADHIYPQSYGGLGSRDNMQLLCKHCNRSKRNSLQDTSSDLKRRKQELKQQEKQERDMLRKMRGE